MTTAQALPKLGGRLAAENLLAAMQGKTHFRQLAALGQGVAAVAVRAVSDDQSAALLLETLKNPLIPRDTVTDAIRKRFSEAPPQEQASGR